MAAYSLEAEVNGAWQSLQPADAGKDPGFGTIGHKKIDRIQPVTTQHIRFRCLQAIARPVQIRSIAVFNSGE